MPTIEPTDAQIRGAIVHHWRREFRNWGGDSLNESLIDLSPEDASAADERVIFDRACALLDGAKITIEWGTPDNDVVLPEGADEGGENE